MKAKVKMNDDGFRQWLTKSKNMPDKQARDVVSRCNRIERVFNVSLDDVVRSQRKLETLLERTSVEADNYLKAGANQLTASSQLRTAARKYAEYKGSN
jgi:hypothetical protein